MGYRTDVRFITTKQGYNELKKYIKENSEKDKGLEDLLEYLDMDKRVKDLVVLGWNNLRGDGVDSIIKFTSELYNKDISFRYYGLGEEITDIEEISHTSKTDEIKYIPYPSIIREFDDNYLNRELKCYAQNYDKEKLNEMEVE